jgi:acetyl esterase/lipase
MKHRPLALVFGLALAANAAADPAMTPPQLHRLAVRAPTVVEHYGQAPLQIGELRVPDGDGPFPVAIVVHGGCYLSGYEDVGGTAPLASALTARGIATWNVDYRAVGDAGGGWPGTFDDLARAADHLRAIAASHRLDLGRVAVVGHSAGAHAALWLASRSRESRAPFAGVAALPIRYAVAIDGPPDLEAMIGTDAKICQQPVVLPLLGGAPSQVPERYREVTPGDHLPLGVPQLLVTSDVLPAAEAAAYRDAAIHAGDRVEVLSMHEGHFGMLDPRTASWRGIEDRIAHALGVP